MRYIVNAEVVESYQFEVEGENKSDALEQAEYEIAHSYVQPTNLTIESIYVEEVVGDVRT